MAFRRPALYTSISAANYQGEIDANFGAIDSAFSRIQNELASIGGASGSSGASNLSFVSRLLQQDGPIGFESWNPTFTQTTDGLVLSLTHELVPGSRSYALISGLLHSSATAINWILDDLIPPSGDGPFRMAVGLNSVGAPGVEQVVVHNEMPTDDPQLLLFSFECIRTTDGLLAANLRREAGYHLSDATWEDMRDRLVPLQTSITRIDADRWFSENTDGVIIVPYDCEVHEIACYCSHSPPGVEYVAVKIWREGHSNPSPLADQIHMGNFTFGLATDALAARTVHTVDPKDPPFVLLKDEYVNIRLDPLANVTTDAPVYPGIAPDERIELTIQLRVRPIKHSPRRYIS